MADLTDEEIQQFYDDEDPDLDALVDLSVRAVDELQRHRSTMKRPSSSTPNLSDQDIKVLRSLRGLVVAAAEATDSHDDIPAATRLLDRLIGDIK